MKTHVEISVLSSLRIQQVKKKKRKRSSLQKLTHFFVRHSSLFTFVLSKEKRNMTLKLLPTNRSDTSTYDCPLNPESKSRKRGTAPNGNDANSRGGGARAKTNYAYGYRPLIERVSSPASLQTPTFLNMAVSSRAWPDTNYSGEQSRVDGTWCVETPGFAWHECR